MKDLFFAIALIVFVTVPMIGQTSRTRSRAATPKPTPVPGKAATQQPTITDRFAVPPPPPPPFTKKEEDEIITIETDLVTTPVTVMDRNGRFIPGLKKKDFKIFENGVAQEVTYFQSEEQPFTVVLMIDTSPSTKYHIDEIHFAAVTFVNQLRPADQVMVVAFDQRPKILCEPTTDKKTLFSAIYKANFGSGTSLYDAVDAIGSLEMENVPGRKAVVLFTDGVDTTSRRASFESTLAMAEEIDALFYPIRYDTQEQMNAGPQIAAIPGVTFPPGLMSRMRGSSAAEYERGKMYLDTLALNSGGRIFEADTLTNLEAAFSGIAEELRRRYSIGYYANTDRVPGERKQIKIQVARPGAVVRGKTNYVVRQKRAPDGPPQVSGS
ncbi:MAG: VWA domain-containing protein [Chloracidobacterium sp.]|nr:VWA domain-containing protein [Chloracidobacterium sp.]